MPAIIQAPNSSRGRDFGKRRAGLYASVSMRATHLLSAYLTILLASIAGFGQQVSRADRLAEVKIDRFVRQEMLAHQIPGVSLAVLRRGKIVLLKSYGLANVE